MGLIPESGKSPAGGHGNPLQYSCRENPMDRGAWWATVQRVAKSQIATAAAKSLQSCLTLCKPMAYSPPSSSVHGIVQARILEWVTMTSCRVPYQPRDQNSISCSSYIAGGFFTIEPPGKPQAFLIPCLWFFVLFCFYQRSYIP